jgi:hypothetical protein
VSQAQAKEAADSWNCRVIEFIDPNTKESWYAIHEVYYDKSGNPYAYSESPSVIAWNGDDDPHDALDRMHAAMHAPILKGEDFGWGVGPETTH